MIWVNFALAVVAWSGILIIEVVLMWIARFFQKNSGKPTFYQLYVIVVLLTLYGAGRYVIRIPQAGPLPDFTGDPVANLCLAGAGLALMVLGSNLYARMMGGSDL